MNKVFLVFCFPRAGGGEGQGLHRTRRATMASADETSKRTPVDLAMALGRGVRHSSHQTRTFWRRWAEQNERRRKKGTASPQARGWCVCLQVTRKLSSPHRALSASHAARANAGARRRPCWLKKRRRCPHPEGRAQLGARNWRCGRAVRGRLPHSGTPRSSGRGSRTRSGWPQRSRGRGRRSTRRPP